MAVAAMVAIVFFATSWIFSPIEQVGTLTHLCALQVVAVRPVEGAKLRAMITA